MGRVTKQGRGEMRWVLVEAGWAAVDKHPDWKAEFERLTQRVESAKAIVTIARKLLVALWHVLTERAAALAPVLQEPGCRRLGARSPQAAPPRVRVHHVVGKTRDFAGSAFG
jgi:hypothetical protein